MGLAGQTGHFVIDLNGTVYEARPLQCPGDMTFLYPTFGTRAPAGHKADPTVGRGSVLRLLLRGEIPRRSLIGVVV